MSTDKVTEVRARATFGEYGLYCDDKLVALIADHHLFVKPTAVATGHSGESWLAPTYPGAKDYYRVPASRLTDPAWSAQFVQRTADALPVRVPQSRKPSAKPR